MSDFESVEDELKFMADLSDNMGDSENSLMFMRFLAKIRSAQSELAALREELATTKKQAMYKHAALEAKAKALTAAEQRNAALAQQASKAFESAARWVESRRDEYINDNGSVDPETGTVEFPGNGEEYVGELDEIAEGLRSLKPTESGASE